MQSHVTPKARSLLTGVPGQDLARLLHSLSCCYPSRCRSQVPRSFPSCVWAPEYCKKPAPGRVRLLQWASWASAPFHDLQNSLGVRALALDVEKMGNLNKVQKNQSQERELPTRHSTQHVWMELKDRRRWEHSSARYLRHYLTELRICCTRQTRMWLQPCTQYGNGAGSSKRKAALLPIS